MNYLVNWSDYAKAQMTRTDSGNFWSSSAVKLHTPNVPSGTMIMALVANGVYGNHWCLFYKQGGDWTSFCEGDEYCSECVLEWMPEAIAAAISEVSQLSFLNLEVVMDNLEWFKEWGETARKTLENRN